MGFILEPDEAQDLIEENPRNKAVLFPYLNGEDLNSRWDRSASRWVINFHDWPIERARHYPDCLAIVEKKVKPQRLETHQKDYREYWWRFARLGLARTEAIRDLDRVLVITRVSRTAIPVFVSTQQVINERIVAFATDDFSQLCLLTSAFHIEWAWTYSGTLRTDLMYSPSDVYEQFPRPTPTARERSAGSELEEFRDAAMARRGIGLTALYNLVHNPAASDEDILRMREIHVEIDEATREAYALDEELEPGIRKYEAKVASGPLPGWRDIELGHGFHEARQGVRFTISAQTRSYVLDKLLALNHYRYEQEVKQGLHSGKGRGGSKKKGAGRTPPDAAPALDDGGLFPPEGTLF